MAVDSTHAGYDQYAGQWEVMRHLNAGEDDVKGAGTTYLPRLGSQSDEQYAAYKMRASFYNATGRTVEGLSGMIFRKDPMTDYPDSMEALTQDVTLSGIPLRGFCEQVVEEVLTPGRCGALVDHPRVDGEGMTRLAAERLNLRPFWTLYKTEDILYWRIGLVRNRSTLTQVRLWECVTEPGEDEFDEEEVEQIRVLELVPAVDADGDPIGETMQYQQRVFRKTETGEWEQFGETIVPTAMGQTLEQIPFVFFGPRDTSPAVCKPPLIDMARVNLSHYRTSADLEHGAHFAALPTPYCFGVNEADAPEEIGPEALWTSPDKDVEVGLLEFTGQGLEPLEKRREVKEQQMAALGARMLAPEKRQAEAAETAAIHRQGEISVLASVSISISEGLTKLMQLSGIWYGVADDEAYIRLNTDFLPAPMSPQLLKALFEMLQGGKISQRVFFDNLQRGEIIDADRDFDEENEDRSDDYMKHLENTLSEDL